MKAKQIVMWIFVGAFLLYGGLAHADSINLAHMYGTASQSSDLTYGGITGSASLAIDDKWLTDGTIDGNWWNGSVSHTNSDYPAYWEVDLGNMYNIDEIVIWNRTDGNQWYLTNFKVSILDANDAEVWSQTYYGSGGYPYSSLTIDFSGAVKSGRTVRIELNNQGSLALAEVQVFGDSNSVPIPGAVWLLGSGLIGLAGIRRKLKRRQ